MTDLVDKLQTQLFQLHSLHVKLEALLESVLLSKPSPQLSVHVLESRRHSLKSSKSRLCLRLTSEGRRMTTKEAVVEKGQTSVEWLETFTFPVEALDGDVKVYLVEKTQGTEVIHGVNSVRLSKLLDQDRHDFWCSVEKAEVRLAIRLVHSPEICYKHALQQVKTKIAKTEILLLSCTIDKEKVDEGIDRLEKELDLSATKEEVDCSPAVLGLKVALARKSLRAYQSLLSRAGEVLLQRVDSLIARKQSAAAVILRAYRRYKSVSRVLVKARSKFFDIHSSESVSFEEEKNEFWADRSESESIVDPPLPPAAAECTTDDREIDAEDKTSPNMSQSEQESEDSSDEEGVNYYDPSTANRFNRFRGVRR